MKFNKKLREYTKKYELYIPPQLWFNYKDIKKRIKYVRYAYFDAENDVNMGNCQECNDCQEGNDCCYICLDERGNMMSTFCCKNLIHYTCFIDVEMRTSVLCPLCRSDTSAFFRQRLHNPCLTVKQQYDLKILEIISNILLNILMIENTYSLITINPAIMQRYREVNFIAVIKIAKKMRKYTSIDITDYLVSYMQRNNVLIPPLPKKASRRFIRWIKAKIKKLMNII